MIDYISLNIRATSIADAEENLTAKVEESRKGESKVKWGLKRVTEKKPTMRPVAGLSAVKAEDITFELDFDELWLVKFLGFRDELVKVNAKAPGFMISGLPTQLRSVPLKFQCSKVD